MQSQASRRSLGLRAWALLIALTLVAAGPGCGSRGSSSSIVLGAGGPPSTFDRVFGDFVWQDLNGNGMQDLDEPGLAGVEIVLSDAGGEIARSTSGRDGSYDLGLVLPAGEYSIAFDPASIGRSFAPTECESAGVGSDLDSNCSPTTLLLASESSTDFTLDFGFRSCTGDGPDCDGDGVVDACETDCDDDGVPDECEIASDPTLDCDDDGVLDACGPDCNEDGVPDACEITDDPTLDCDGNGVLDACELGCEETLTLVWDLDACLAFADASSFAEFVGTTAGDCTGASVAPGTVAVEDGVHACTDDALDGAAGDALVVAADDRSDYEAGAREELIVPLVVEAPEGSTSALKGFRFCEEAAPTWVHTTGDGFFRTGVNDYPTLFALRVLRDGEEVFRSTDLPTSTSWARHRFTFSGTDFEVDSGQAAFELRLVSYAPIELGGNRMAWSLDQLEADVCCTAGAPDCDGDGVLDACEADMDGDGLPDDCEGVSLAGAGAESELFDPCAVDDHPAAPGECVGGRNPYRCGPTEKWSWSSGATFTELENGTARLVGRLEADGLGGIGGAVLVDVTLYDRVVPGERPFPEPFLSGFSDLPDSYLADSGGPVDPATWRFYKRAFGTLIGAGLFAGLEAEWSFDDNGWDRPLQLGVGASGRSLGFGASGRFSQKVKAQPYDGRFCFKTDFVPFAEVYFEFAGQGEPCSSE